MSSVRDQRAPEPAAPKLSAEETAAFVDEVFPEVRGRFEIAEIGPMRARVRMVPRAEDLRPGGTVSGPAMFALADVAFYIATLAMIGREALTVTTSLSINFMRKPEAGRALVAEARIMKLGRSLSVGDVSLAAEGDPAAIVAHASVTYAIPPARREAGR